MICSHCTKKSEENKICFHCEKAYCIHCFTSHVSQFKSKSSAILKQLEETKKQWHNLVEVLIIIILIIIIIIITITIIILFKIILIIIINYNNVYIALLLI